MDPEAILAGTRPRRQSKLQRAIGLSLFADNGGEPGGAGGDPAKPGGGEPKESPEVAQMRKDLETATAELERFQAKHKEAEKHRKEAERKAREEAEAAAKQTGDVKALEESWRKKLETVESEKDARIQALSGTVSKLTAGATAATIAGELAMQGSSDVLMPHISARLTTEYVDDEAIVRVLSKDGKPSALSIDELKAEIKSNPAFAPILVGTKANGAGGSDQQASGGGATIKRADLDAKSPKERAAFFKANPEAKVIQ